MILKDFRSPRKWLRRAWNKAAREAVNRLGIPPSYFGYQHLKLETPKDHIARLQSRGRASTFEYQCLEPPGWSRGPLPVNLSSREGLSKTTQDGPFEFPFSFFDVPERKTTESYVVTIPNCRIVSSYDQWGAEFCAIVTADDRLLGVRGTAFTPEHAQTLRSAGSCEHTRKASWIFEIWSQNYFHWLVYHLPKIVLLKRCGLAGQIILPKSNNSMALIESSLEYLGLKPFELPRLSTALLHVDELTVVGIDCFPGPILRTLRDEIAGLGLPVPYRKIFISRANAERRRLENEDEVWKILQAYGYELITMERLSFREQITLMSETAVLFGASGAGLANMLFCPAGAHVLEIYDPLYPAPDFYALATALGHSYWLLRGSPVADGKPGYRDLVANTTEVREIIERVERSRRSVAVH